MHLTPALVVAFAAMTITACAGPDGQSQRSDFDAAAFASSRPALSTDAPSPPTLDISPERRAQLQSTIDSYNRTYAQGRGYNSRPNAHLLFCLDRIADIAQQEARRSHWSAVDPLMASAPKALDIAMGDGRNTVALAQCGYEAHGFDISDVGVQQAQARAAQAGVAMQASVADAYAFDYGTDRWDVVTLMYFGLPEEHLARVKDSVKPGGFIILERNSQEGRGWIHNPQRYPRNQLLKAFVDWDIIHYEHALLARDWGAHQVEGSRGLILRLLARKPPSQSGQPSASASSPPAILPSANP